MVIVLDDEYSKLTETEEGVPHSRPRSPSVPPPYAPRETEPLLPLAAAKSRPSAAARFARAYAIAVLAFCAVVALLSQCFDSAHPIVEEAYARPGPDDGEVLRCVRGAEYLPADRPLSGLQTAFSSFTIPLSAVAPSISIYSRGIASRGSIEFLPSTHTDDTAIILVSISHRSRDVLRQSSLCLLQSQEGVIDFGIFTPDDWLDPMLDHIPAHYLTVLLPVSGPRTHLQNIHTVLPMFSHFVGDLAPRGGLASVSLRSSHAPITIQSLHAHNATLVTDHAPIVGNLHFVDDLLVSANDGTITAAITVRDAPNPHSKRLNLIADRGSVSTMIHVVGVDDNPPTDWLDPSTVVVHTLNGPLTVMAGAPIWEARLKVQRPKESTVLSPGIAMPPPQWEGWGARSMVLDGRAGQLSTSSFTGPNHH